MVWRCFGKGIAAAMGGYILALFLDRVWPLGSQNGPFLALLLVAAAAAWGASHSRGFGQGALRGALTVFCPAALWTLLFNAIQYEWGGPQVFDMGDLYMSLFLLGVPVGLGAVFGAVVGQLNAKKLPRT